MKGATILLPILALLLTGSLFAQNSDPFSKGPATETPASEEPGKGQPHPRLFTSEDDFRKAVAFVWSKNVDGDGCQEITFANRMWYFTGTFWKGACHRLRIYARPPLAQNSTDGMDDVTVQKLEMSGDMDKFIQAVLQANQGDSTWKCDDSNPLAKAKGVWEWKRVDGKAQAKYVKGTMEFWSTEFSEMQRKSFQQHFLGGF